MTLKRDGTPQRMNPAGMMSTDACPVCGRVMRKCNLARHARRRHDPTYVPASRTAEYRRTHRTPVWGLLRDRKRYYAAEPGTLYLIHFARPISGHAGHYMGWTDNLQGRLVAHATGMGSKLTREARRQRIAFALTWTGRGTRNDEQAIKKNRKLAELCSLCRDDALAKRAARMRAWRTTKEVAV